MERDTQSVNAHSERTACGCVLVDSPARLSPLFADTFLVRALLLVLTQHESDALAEAEEIRQKLTRRKGALP